MPVKTSNAANFANAAISAQVTSASTTYVSTGVGVAMTPLSTGNILVISQGSCNNGTTGDGVTVTIYRTTGAIPSAGSAVAGTALTSTYTYTFLTGLGAGQFVTVDIDTPTIGTAYNYYIAYKAVTGGTASIGVATSGVGSIIAVEI